MMRIPSSGSCNASRRLEQTLSHVPVRNSRNQRTPQAFRPTSDESWLFLQAASAALDERSKADAMKPAVNHAALRTRFFLPTNLFEGLLEDRAKMTGIELAGSSYVIRRPLLNGISCGVTKLRRRISAGSMPRSTAAMSINRLERNSLPRVRDAKFQTASC